MSIFKKAAAFLTAVGIACSCAACGYNTINALSVDGVDVPAGVYIYYVNSEYNNALSELQKENKELDTTDQDAVKALTLDGKDITTWVQDKATEDCAKYVMIEKKFDELGLELDEEKKSNISMMKEYYWNNSKETFEKNGISEASFDKIVTSSYKSDEIFAYYYGVDGENGVTEEELYDFYKEDNIRCEYLTVSLKDGEGNLLKSDGKAEVMDMVKDYQHSLDEALKNGGIDAVKSEMDAIRQDYQIYTESLTASAEDTETEEETDEEITEETTEETTTDADAADSAADEDDTTEAEDSAADEDDTTEAETEEGEVTAETFNTAAPSATTEAETETVGDEDDTTEAETKEDSEDEAETEEETDEESETEEASDEDGAEDESTVDADLLTTGDEESAGDEEPADPYANESIISVIHEEDYDDPEDISYNPSEKVYKKLLEIGEKDYGKPYIVEEDENYYLVIRYDIEDRMTEDDLWGEDGIQSALYAKYSKTFEDELKGWADALNIQRNAAAYKRYDPFKLDFS